VLICNPTFTDGLNLAYFKRVAFKRIPLQAATLHRSACCLLQRGQDENVETVVFTYRDSVASRLLQRWAFPYTYSGDDILQKLPEDGQRTDVIREIAQAMIEAMGQDGAALTQD
jgi:hypothetical protein